MKKMIRIGAALGTAALLVTGLASPASASGKFNSGSTSIVSRDDGLYVGTLEVQVYTYGAASYHADIWGPGFKRNLKTEYVTGNRRYIDYVKLNRVFREGDRICAQGWKYNGHGYDSLGLPCFTIHAS